MYNKTVAEYDAKQLLFKINSILRELMIDGPKDSEEAYSAELVALKNIRHDGTSWYTNRKMYTQLTYENGRMIRAKSFDKLPLGINIENVINIDVRNHNNLLYQLVKGLSLILRTIDRAVYKSTNLDFILKLLSDYYTDDFDITRYYQQSSLQASFASVIIGKHKRKTKMLNTALTKFTSNLLENYREFRLPATTLAFFLAYSRIMNLIYSRGNELDCFSYFNLFVNNLHRAPLDIVFHNVARTKERTVSCC